MYTIELYKYFKYKMCLCILNVPFHPKAYNCVIGLFQMTTLLSTLHLHVIPPAYLKSLVVFSFLSKGQEKRYKNKIL